MKSFVMVAVSSFIAVVLGASFCLADINDELFEAIEANDIQKVEDLLSSGADVNAKFNNLLGGFTSALDYAISNGSTDIAKFLIEKGADVNYQDSILGYTALMDAARYGYTEIVELFLERGAEVNIQDYFTGYSALMNAVVSGQTETARVLIEHGADINLTDTIVGLTAFLWAISGCHTETAELLLANGADVNARTADGSMTALMYAVTCPEQMIEFLIKQGADVNAKDGTGSTVLMRAAKSGEMGNVELLIDNGADVNAKDGAGFTALMMAVESDEMGNVGLLIANGAEVNAQSNNGDTALSLAESNEMISYLRRVGAEGDKMPIQVPSSLSEADIGFLLDECQIDRTDIDVIPNLKEEIKERLFISIVRRDCGKLNSFKVTREFLKKYTPPPDESIIPPREYNGDFLTEEESSYINEINTRILDRILENL